MQSTRLLYQQNLYDNFLLCYQTKYYHLHQNILELNDGINDLRNKANNTDIIFNMMPDKFTIGELKQVYEIIQDIFANIFKNLNIDGKVMILENDEAYEVKVMGDEKVASLIGFRGEGLNAYQFLINNFLSLRNKSKKIYLDVENYRNKREESLKALAVRIAKKVLKTKRKHKFEPMTAYERHVIHEELSNFKGVSTHSEGNEPHRCLVVDIDNGNN